MKDDRLKKPPTGKQEAFDVWEHMASTTTDLLSLVDRNYIYRAVNDGYLKAYNRSREEIVGHPARELLGPEVFDTFVKGYLDRCFAGEQIRYQSWFNYPALGHRFMDITYHHCFDTDGNISGIFVNSHDITDLQTTREALKESEEKYQSILEDIQEGYWEVDLAGNFTSFNNAICRLLGYPQKKLMGMNYRAYTKAEDVDKVYKAFNQVYRTGKSIRNMHYEINQKESSKKFAETSVFPKRNDKGEIIGFRGVSHDVTERLQMEEALRQSEERYRTIMDQMHDDYFEVDLAGNFTFVNDSFCQSVGYTNEELMGKSYRLTTKDEYQEKMHQAFNLVYHTGEPNKDIRFEYIKKDGTIRDAELSAFPLRNKNGKIIGFRGVSHDVTERLQMEETLRRSEERYRTIMDETHDNYFEVDMAGNYTFVNDSFCHGMGYDRKEILGKSYEFFTAGEDVKKVYEAFHQVYLTGQPVKELSFKFLRKDGSTGVGEISAFVLRNENGDMVGFRGVIYNVTKRMIMEEALRQSEARYRTILEEIEEGYYETDLNGNYTFFNDVICKKLGYSREELMGTNYQVHTAPEDVKKISDAYAEIYRTGKPLKWFPPAQVRKDGTRLFAEDLVSVLRNEKGEIIGFRGISRDVTERIQMEETLRRSEERYRTVLEDMEESYYEVDSAGNFTFFNDALCRQLGYSREELMGMNYKVYTPSEDVEEIFKIYNQVYRTGEPVKSFPLKRLRKDGTIVLAESSVFPIRNAKGEVIGFRGVIRDVTELMQMTEALRQSEEKYRNILEGMEESYYEVDLAGNYIFFNNALCRQLGYSREELIGMNYRVYIPPDDVNKVFQAYNQVYRTGEPIKFFDMSQIRKDGTRLVAQTSVFPLRNETGEIVGFRGVGRDVTKRIRMEEALRQSEEKYRTVMENIEEAYFEVDLAGNYTFFNDALCRQLGYSREELMGMNYGVYTPPERQKKAFETYNRIYRTGEPAEIFDAIQIRKDGKQIFVESSAAPIRNQKGEIVGFRGVTRDITERKQAEEEKRQLEQKAQLASRLASVGELASGVAHEINNPLTGVIGYAHLLLARKDIPKDMIRDVEIINEGAQRVASIVKKLLAFARQTRPEQRYVNINELIHNTLDLQAYALASNNIKVSLQLARDIPMTIADPGQLQQVFLNLIMNAETAMKLARGRGKLSIKTEHSDNTIRISFKDTGPGIAKETMESIFDPFFTTREVGQGTGLGLSVCHGIVAEHKGRIWVESDLGKGATFIVELPIVTEDKQLEMPEPVIIEEPKKVAKAKILVVDDEPVIRQLISQVLGEEGHEVETIDNAADALKMVNSKRYRLILLDIKMPGMSGVELYKKFQKIAPSITKRVVFITGDVMGKRTMAFLDKTKAPCLMKPFDAKQLKTDIKRILARR